MNPLFMKQTSFYHVNSAWILLEAEPEALIGGAEAAKSSNEKLIISNAYDNEFFTVNGESASSNVFWNFNKKTDNQSEQLSTIPSLVITYQDGDKSKMVILERDEDGNPLASKKIKF